MGTNNFYIAFLLIVNPVDETVASNYSYLSFQMRAIAADLELIDKKEQYFSVFDFKTLASSLHDRWKRCHHLPRTHMHNNFPVAKVLQEYIDQNIAYAQHLRNLRHIKCTDDYIYIINEMILEVEALRQIYYSAYHSKLDTWYVTSRRESLQTLLDKIGPQNFYSGCLPPHVPLQYFRRMD